MTVTWGLGTILATFVPFVPFVVCVGRAEGDEAAKARFHLVQPRVDGKVLSGRTGGVLSESRERPSGLPPALLRLQDMVVQGSRLQELCVRAGAGASGSRYLHVCLLLQLGAGLSVLFFTKSIFLSALVGGAASCAPFVLLYMQGRRRLKRMESILPQVVEMMARSLRSGHSLPAALSIVAEQAPEPARAEFGELFRKQKFGLPLRDALLELLARVPSQDLRVLVVGILVQRETGGNLTLILDRTSTVIRERLKLRGDIRVHTAQGRLTGWILCALPVLLFAVMHFINPGYSKILTEDALGRKCLYGGSAAVVLGAFLIRQIVNGIEV